MYLGDLVEVRDADAVYHHPAHRYTRVLHSVRPHPHPHYQLEDSLKLDGEIPTPLDKSTGCGFRTRCPFATCPRRMSPAA